MKTKLLQIKRISRRRGAEYFGLIFFFGFFAYRFSFSFDLIALLSVAIMLGVFSFFLALKRERRRLLDYLNKYRLIADSIESLAIGFFIAIATIVAYSLEISILIFSAYFCFAFIGYLFGAYSGENYFRKKYLETISEKELDNYLTNLNKSIIIPFNYKNFKRS